MSEKEGEKRGKKTTFKWAENSEKRFAATLKRSPVKSEARNRWRELQQLRTSPRRTARSSDISFGGYWPEPRGGGGAAGGGVGVLNMERRPPLVGQDAPIRTQTDGRLSAAVMSFRSHRRAPVRFRFSFFFKIYLFSGALCSSALSPLDAALKVCLQSKPDNVLWDQGGAGEEVSGAFFFYEPSWRKEV